MSNEALEVTGKSLEEAREAAAAALGIPVEEIEYEVVAEPKKILGMIGSGHYTLRAWRQGETPPAPTPSAQAPAAPAEGDSRPSPEEVARRAQEIVLRLFSMMSMEATADIISADADGIVIDVKSVMSPGLLIGRHGDTLDALQFIVGVGANRGEHGGYRVTLDLGGYRRRQEEQLRQTAIDTAVEAVKTGQEAVLPGLKAYERRIVHSALADRDDVETYSEGEGEQRQLVISPKNLAE